MLVNLDPNDVRPLYLQIMDEVRRALVIGTLHENDPLPSVRELSSQLLINPRTVSQAYQELEREGVIFVRRGHGTFVSPDSRPDEEQRRALRQGVARRVLLETRRNGISVDELMESILELVAREDSLASASESPYQDAES
ncbi:MAG: Transcriptional regulator, GntR family [Gemmatimonadetes bacterium]|nr:Transcriptional regulator, GntR family [Gemmatimonadota bacterium]